MQKSKKNTDLKSKKAKAEEAEALTRFICSGLYGFGCGTEHTKISKWRREKNWEDKCRRFHERGGD